MSIMVSYSSKDWNLVSPIVVHLRENNIELWIDREQIKPPMIWRLELLRAPQKTRGIMPFLSSNYIASEMCRMELYIARSMERPIFPVMIEECWAALDSVEETKYLSTIFVARLSPPKIVGLETTKEEVLSRIVRAVRACGRQLDREPRSVFISYSYGGGALATELQDELSKRGASSWVATRNCEIGENWRNAQIQAMSQCNAHLVVINEQFFDDFDVLRTEIIMSEVYGLPTFCILADSLRNNKSAMDEMLKNIRDGEEAIRRLVTRQWFSIADIELLKKELQLAARNSQTWWGKRWF